ncbi:IS481 family transposase [Janibacter alkaliphilus]|uniref:Transposase InsO family protein n=1 Tax=Janibacter alkaliphilus TaxID=1069963 RepID=A0A852XH82_9MICO|nr:IS481 family transposase [Janibacter alkaliphilus]NYG37895.1 transposase InsO family protein [Janibacter alkaliphilus]
MSHGNARLTVYGRRLIVERRQKGWAKAHIAASLGVSRKCVNTWIERYEAEGEAGLVTRSSTPRTTPTKTSAEDEQRVLAARHEYREGPDLLGPRVGVAPRTVSRILRRHQVPYLHECDPMTGQVIRSSKQTTRRYERDRPGELVHVDVKKIGKIPDGGGWRVHGRAATEAAKTCRPRIGYDYIHAMVDDHTRLAYCEALPDEQGPTCAGFILRAAAYFAAHGITRIERVITDNHWSYRRSRHVREALATLDARHLFIRPHCPWQNGKVERFNRTLATEWAYHQPYTTNDQRTAALAPWLEHYNTQRRHSALGGHPPTHRLPPT